MGVAWVFGHARQAGAGLRDWRKAAHAVEKRAAARQHQSRDHKCLRPLRADNSAHARAARRARFSCTTPLHRAAHFVARHFERRGACQLCTSRPLTVDRARRVFRFRWPSPVRSLRRSAVGAPDDESVMATQAIHDRFVDVQELPTRSACA